MLDDYSSTLEHYSLDHELLSQFKLPTLPAFNLFENVGFHYFLFPT